MLLSGLHVLLAEDNPTNQLVATQMLQSMGATVEIAGDGAEAIEVVRRGKFDVMLVDIEMPRLNGIEVMRLVRGSDGPLADMPMIALTAYVMHEHVVAIDKAGADGLIAKPILSIARFGEDILRFMRRRAALGEANQSGGAGRATIDLDVYDALADAIGAASMADLLGKVKADIAAAGERVETAFGRGDLEEIRASSHILISVAGAIGAVHAQELARKLNIAAHDRNVDAIGRDAPLLLVEIRLVLDFVQSRMKG